MAEIETSEPEVMKSVLAELKKFGDNTKTQYDELRKNYEELKHTVDGGLSDPLAEAKFRKFAEDVTIRQQALDESFQKSQKEAAERIDAIETAMNRPGRGGNDSKESADEIRQYAMNVICSKRVGDEGIRPEELDNVKFGSNEYDAFCKSFNGWARSYGGDRNKVVSESNLKALQVGVGPDGGITVPVAMSNRIIKRVHEMDPIRQLASVESITTGRIEWMVETDEAGAEWANGETVVAGETSTPGWQKKTIIAHELTARPRATQVLLEDSGINIEQWLANKIAEKFSRSEGAAFVSGNSPTQPRGFLTYANGTTWGTIEQVNMGAAAALTADGFVDIKYSLREYFLERGTWLMNRTTVQAAMKLKNGDGDYIWKPAMLAADPSSTILGLPIRMSTTMPTVAANALSIALADWREAYMIVDRIGITVQRDPYTAKPFIEFYTRKRVGGDVVNYDAIKIGKIAA